jgi:flagellar hook-basal body protein
MASTTSLFTGLSGLVANSRRLDVIGNNISNVNTTAFKSTRMAFAPSFSRTFSLGSAPGTTSGGTNPAQIGLGVTVASTQRNFNNGPIGGTGVTTDIAIEGDGFFIMDVAGTQHFTRAGNFLRNPDNDLVSQSGAKVLGSFTVGAGARIGSNSVVTKTVPPGATAVGIPARIISDDVDQRREADANRMGFSAYAITQGADDPLSVALHQLIDHVAEQDKRIDQLLEALERLGVAPPGQSCEAVPLDAGRLSRLVD